MKLSYQKTPYIFETKISGSSLVQSLFYFILLCYVMLCYVMLCYVMLCYVMLCFVLFCFALLCFVMFCFVLFCFDLLFFAFCVSRLFSSFYLFFFLLSLPAPFSI